MLSPWSSFYGKMKTFCQVMPCSLVCLCHNSKSREGWEADMLVMTSNSQVPSPEVSRGQRAEPTHCKCLGSSALSCEVSARQGPSLWNQWLIQAPCLFPSGKPGCELKSHPLAACFFPLSKRPRQGSYMLVHSTKTCNSWSGELNPGLMWGQGWKIESLKVCN